MSDKTEYVISLKDLFTKGINEADKASKNLDSTVITLQKTIAKIGASVGIAAFAKSVFDTTLQIDSLKNSLDFISGGNGSETFEYLRKTSDEMGLSLESSAQGFKQIAGAARGTILEGQKTREIFEGVSMASSVMGLSAEQSEGALLALSQMISKGKVQAEELRGQLGERIPGAFQIAARAMNMTTKELDKFMSDGNLLAEEFLPRFANQLKSEFSGGMAVATESLAAQTNRLKTEFLLLKTQIGDELRPVIIGLLQIMRGAISVVKDAIKFIKEHKDGLTFLAFTIGGVVLALKAYSYWLNIVSVVQGAKFLYGLVGMTAGLQGMTTAQYALNFAMSLNPLGLVIVAVAALTAGIMILIDQYDELIGKVNNAKVTGEGIIEKRLQSEVDALMKVKGMTLEVAQTQALATEKRIALKAYEMAKMEEMKLASENGILGPSDELLKARMTTIGTIAALKKLTQKNLFDGFAKKPEVFKGADGVKGASGIDGAKAPKHTVITINIDKLIEKFTIATNTVTEGAQSIKEMVVKALIEAVNDSQIIAGV